MPALAAAVAAATATGVGASPAPKPPLGELVGARLVVAMAGTMPSPALLGRVRRGEIGGVILFAGNASSPSQVRRLTDTLRAAATAGGRGRAPLVVVDQEGGQVRRLRWLGPALDAAALGQRSIPAVRAAGRRTAQGLRRMGIDVDLAPVADVPRVPGSFLVAQRRALSTDAERVASRAAAFARGLAEGGVHATAKHFPGLGGAGANTDLARVTVTGTAAELAADLVPFRRLVAAGVPLVMLSSATHPAYGGGPALFEPGVHRLLREELGFTGVTISDALEAVAQTRRLPLEVVALRAARAGTDLLLFAGPEAETARVRASLLAAARSGRLSRGALEASYRRVQALASAGARG